MTSINILSTEDLGENTKVVVELYSAEVFSVNRELVEGSPELVDGYRAEEYHSSLHDNRVEHDHGLRACKTTLWVENPYTLEKLNIALEEQVASLEDISYLDYLKPIDGVQEVCIVDGVERLFYRPSECPSTITDTLVAAFPDVDLANIAMISAPAYHDLVQQTVISVFLVENRYRADGGPSDGDTPLVCICRKYCLEAGKYYDRYYSFITEDDNFSFIPDSCTLLAKSYNTNIQEGLVIPEFYDVYFAGDVEVIESAFNLPHHVGEHRTYYAVTVSNNEVVRAKQYCYDTFTLFSGWHEQIERLKLSHNLA